MRNALIFLLSCLVSAIFLIPQGFAHTPLCFCEDNGDGTITCEGGFSDGSSGAGGKMKVVDTDGNVLVEGKMDEDSEFTFKKPEGDYTVILDAGPGHEVEIPGSEIRE